MSDPVIIAKDVTVRFRIYADRNPSVRRVLAGRRRQYRAVEALRNVSVTVRRGEALGVIGKNGAGKSTLLRVLAGTLVPDEGLVERRGQAPTLLELGVGFNQALSGRRNIILGGLAAGQTKVRMEELTPSIVDFAEMEEAIDRPVSTYSSGMRSRLAFSIAMQLEPETMLIDELLTVGDASFRAKSRQAMDAMLDRAGTVVIVSHSMPRVRSMCDRVVWLENGTVRSHGDADEIIDAYLESVAEPGSRQDDLPPVEDWGAKERFLAVRRIMKGEPAQKIAEETGAAVDDLVTWRKIFVRGGRRALHRATMRETGDD